MARGCLGIRCLAKAAEANGRLPIAGVAGNRLTEDFPVPAVPAAGIFAPSADLMNQTALTPSA